MTLLCGTDFSEHSLRAVEVAARLAARMNTPLALAHALAPARAGAEELRRAELGYAERELQRIADRAREHGAKVDVYLEDGAPDEVLIDLGQRLSARLIAVAALGQRKAGAFQVGSHAERLAQRSQIPVLVVRDDAALSAFARGERPLRVLIAVDESLSSDTALAWVNTLRALGPCELIAVHLYWPPTQFKRLGLHGVRSYIDPDPEVTRVLSREFTARFAAAGISEPPRFRLEPHLGRVGERIAAIADEERADLLVVGSHARTTLERIAEGSVSRDLLHYAHSAVACVPAPVSVRAASAPELRSALVATDFSELGNAAIPLPFGLLGRGGIVHLVHVVPERTLRAAEPHDIFPADPSAHAAERQKLAELVPGDAAQRGIEVRPHVLESNDVALAICQAAERLGAKLVCVGTHGRGGLSKALLGSVAQKVVSETSRPVLLAKKPAP